MIQAIIYANRGRFYLFERTPGFPDAFTEDIYRICGSFTSGDGSCTTALRYQPLRDHYLLSVIFRLPNGNADERRPHSMAVNFLMDRQDADDFFAAPFTDAAHRAIQAADKLLSFRDQPLPTDVCQSLISADQTATHGQASDIPLPLLLTGMSYGMYANISLQLFLQTAHSPVAALHNLIHFLPPKLRRELRFHTDCLAAAESHDITICFSSILEKLVASNFSMGASTSKYWYYGSSQGHASYLNYDTDPLMYRLLELPVKLPLYELLKPAITDWTVYRELSLLMKQDSPTLKDVLAVLPDDEAGRAIRFGTPDPDALRALSAAAPRRSRVRSAVEYHMTSSRNGAPAIRRFVLPAIMVLLILSAAFCLYKLYLGRSLPWLIACIATLSAFIFTLLSLRHRPPAK